MFRRDGMIIVLRRMTALLAVALAMEGCAVARAHAAPYPTRAAVEDYLMDERSAEIALARTAAPPSVSAAADVLVLRSRGSALASKGTNGFVCLVQRAWFSGLEDDGFWNPKLRGPICFNRQAAASVLPMFLTRTTWALAGVSRPEILRRTREAMRRHEIPPPSAGAMTFMMSKDGYLGDGPHGPWRPHIMFYMPPMPTADWGADLHGTQIFGSVAGADPYTLFYIPVATWSDGTPDGHADHSM